MSLAEVKCLIQLQHLNIVKLKEVIRSDNSELYLIFELLQTDMHDFIKKKRKSRDYFDEQEIKFIVYSILRGISYIHKRGFFHRDLKPDNILIFSKDESAPISIENTSVKISDFGLCREINSMPPFTEYISTRWYRAPESVLRSRSYNHKVDIFAVGCIMAELFML